MWRNKSVLKGILTDIWREIKTRPLTAPAVAVMIIIGLTAPMNLSRSYDQRLENLGINDNENYILEGQIGYISTKDTGEAPQMIIKLQEVRENGRIITNGSEYITVYCDRSELYPGQRIVLRGRVKYYREAGNPGQYDALKANYTKNNLFMVNNAIVIEASGKRWLIRTGLYKIRCKGEEILQRRLGDEDGGIMKAMIFGSKGDLNEDVKASFQKNGIAHILAISGLHISFLGILLFKLLTALGLGRLGAAALGEIIILLYGMMVGFSPSAFRAICMYTIMISGRVIKRSYDMLSALSLAALLLLTVNYKYFFDIGFRLSFLAVLAIGFFYYGFTICICRPSKVLSSLYVSLFVFLITLPVLLGTYYQVAFYSILLNLIIIPPMSLLIGSSMVLLLLDGIVLIPRVCTLIIKFILGAYKILCALLEKYMTGRVNIGSPNTIKVVIYYLILIFICFFLPYYIDEAKKRKLVWWAGCLTALLLLCINPHRGMYIHILDVGQGDGCVIENDNGNVYIVDGGSSSVSSVGQYRIIPFLKYRGINEVELILLSHPDGDHINGLLELLRNQKREHINVKALGIYSGFAKAPELEELIAEAERNDTRLILMGEDDTIEDRRLKLSCVYPQSGGGLPLDYNNSSMVIRLTYPGIELLLTGDVEEEGEKIILEKWIRTNFPADDGNLRILKIAHHGSSTSSSKAFLDRYRPDVALISYGENNSYGHPHRETLERLEDLDCKILTTADRGAISVRTYKGRIEIRTVFD